MADRQRLNQTINNFFAAMNAHDVEKMAALCSPEVVAFEVAETEPFRGLAAFKRSYQEVFEGYPDCTAEILERYIDGDNVICQVRWRATNTGTFRGAPASGKPVDLRIAYFFKLEQDQIAQITEYYDLATILVQQGQLKL